MPKVKQQARKIENCKHPNSRKTKALGKQLNKQISKDKSKLSTNIKQNLLGEKLVWFRDNLNAEEEHCAPSDIELLILKYLGRFDEELEQIKLKHSIGHRKNRQHASREDIINMTLKHEKEEFKTCGVGYEQDIIDLAGQFLKTNITYVNKDLPVTCKKNGRYTGLWQKLYSHSCDAVIGAIPCMQDLPDFEISSVYLPDAMLLIGPKTYCPRRYVGLWKIGCHLTVIILLYSAIKILIFLLLSKDMCNGDFNISTSTNCLPEIFLDSLQMRKISIISILLFSVIIFEGIIQGKIYDGLVHSQEHCGLQSLNEVIKLKEKVGVEKMIYPLLSQATNEMNRKYLESDNNMEHLDVTKCHILRLFLYNYLNQKHLAAHGQPLFNKIEILGLVPIGVRFYRRHYLLKNMSAALSVVFQSGLITKQLFSEEQQESAKENKLLTYFSPIKFDEMCWLLWSYLISVGCCVLVFLVEIYLAKLKIQN